MRSAQGGPAASRGPRRADEGDVTARSRIRDAAVRHFGVHGFSAVRPRRRRRGRGQPRSLELVAQGLLAGRSLLDADERHTPRPPGAQPPDSSAPS